MFGLIKRRSLWVVAPYFVIFGPIFGMLFINRGLIALLYLFLTLAPSVVGSLSGSGLDVTSLVLASLVVWLVGLIHGIILAVRRNKDERLKWYANWSAILAVTVVAMAILSREYLGFRSFVIPSGAMEPTIGQGDRLIANMAVYKGAKIERGDVVIFHMKDNPTFWIKRVIGLPGDTVQMVDGKLRLNGADLPTQKIAPFHMASMGGRDVQQNVETLPNGRHYRVLDLVDNGMLDNTGVYTVPDGQYFVLGDNRDNSNDSRNPEFGLVPRDGILGRATYLYWSGREHRPEFQRVE